MAKKAFTLLEVMVVIILISIIAAFAIPTYSKSQQRSHEKDMINNLILMREAAFIYHARTDSFPAGGPFDLNQINALLGTEILANQKTYQYTSTIDPTKLFQISGLYTTPTGENIQVGVDQTSVDTTAVPPNPCCVTNNCLALADC